MSQGFFKLGQGPLATFTKVGKGLGMPTKKRLPARRLVLIANKYPQTLMLFLAQINELPHQTD